MAGASAAVWLFILLNYALSALMYSLLARFVLSAFLEPGSANYIFRFFIRLTEPVARLVSLVTPRAVPQPVVILFSAVWMLILRFILFLALSGTGLLPAARG